MKKQVRALANVLLILVLMLATLTGVVSAQGGGTTIASGLNGPMGVLVTPDGSVWVIDSGVGGESGVAFPNLQTGEMTTAKLGQTARVVRIAPDSTQTVVASLPSVVVGMDTIGGARLALLNDTLYVTTGQWRGNNASSAASIPVAVVKIADSQVTGVADTWAFEKSYNPDSYILESHPYGLAAGPDGNLWVADAGANDLLKLDLASGNIELVTVFAGVPSPFPNPNRGSTLEADPVPTGITFDQAGNIFVSLLPGAPFTAGSAKIVQVTPDGQVSDYATGLTTLTDVTAGPDGNLYAVQFGQFTQQGPAPDSGAIIRVKPGNASEVLISGLSFPTSIDFNQAGDAYVTINGVGAPGSGAVVRFAGLTAQTGSALAPTTMPDTGSGTTASSWSLMGLLALGFSLVAGSFLLKRRMSLVGVDR